MITFEKFAKWYKAKSFTREVAFLVLLYNLRVAERALESTQALEVLRILWLPSLGVVAAAYGLTKAVDDGLIGGGKE